MDDFSANQRRGKGALAVCIGAILALSILVTRDWRAPINFVHAHATTEALKAFARHDTRYLALRSPGPATPPLPLGFEFVQGETVEIDRDVRLVPEIFGGPEAVRLQHEYLMLYNAEISRLRARTGVPPPPRPYPISWPMAAAVCAVALLPVIANLYIRYRLGPFRLDGKPWTVSLTSETYTYLRMRTYSNEATRWVYALWISMILMAPWAFWVVWTFGRGRPPL